MKEVDSPKKISITKVRRQSEQTRGEVLVVSTRVTGRFLPDFTLQRAI